MFNNRLYLDNAATSFPKPPEVLAAINHYFQECGASPGRGGYAESSFAGEQLMQCREAICELLGGKSPDHVVFTFNGSDSLNLAIKGLIHPGKKNHAICTNLDHNSVIRPLHALADLGWTEVTRVAVDPRSGRIDPEDIRRAIRPHTKLIAMTHVSNVIGTIQPAREVGQIARAAEIPFLLDAAQSAGHLPIDVEKDCVDLLAAPGHKHLMGPLGTGLLYIRPGMEDLLRPLKEGGTGSASENDRQPETMPDRYETGSRNAPGLIGLLEGVRWVNQQRVENLQAHDRKLSQLFLDRIADCDGLTLYGPKTPEHRVGVFSVRIEGFDPQELSAILESHYGILTRSGMHCAPHTHRALGTFETGGTTRVSFGPFTTESDIGHLCLALREISTSL